IQAGAHIGGWPRQLAQDFNEVTCVGPEPENWGCLGVKLGGATRIQAWDGVLADVCGPGAGRPSVQATRRQGHNIAARPGYRGNIIVPVYAIDDWSYDDVDALFLDIEGYELYALLGAEATLRRCRPLLVLEENSCSQRYGIKPGKLSAWLRDALGYDEVGTY